MGIGSLDPGSWIVHPWVSEGKEKLRFGIGLPWDSNDWIAQRDLAQAVDALDYDSLWAIDHPSWYSDCWTTLAAYAATTNRVRLGSLVSCIYYRSPWLLARQTIDVDRVSNGRAILGVGAGWLANEFAIQRIPFPSTTARMTYFTETVHELQRIFRSPPVTDIFSATSDELAAAGLAGLSVQQPRIPLLVGGSGEKVTLRLVAECSDACSVESDKASSPEEVAHKFEVAHRYCQERGRPTESLIRSHYHNVFALAESDAELADQIERLPPADRPFAVVGDNAFTLRDLVHYYRPIVAAGANYLMFTVFGGVNTERIVRLFAKRAMPELREWNKRG